MYKEILNNDFVNAIIANDWSWHDVMYEVVKQADVYKTQIGDTSFDCVLVPNPEKIRSWYENNIGKIEIKNNKLKPKAKLVYHGVHISGKVLSEASGYTLNTIYAYWQKSNKNGEAFSNMIDNKMPPEKRELLLNEYKETTYSIDNDEDFEIIC